MFNTASVRSKISYIDGDKGILRYRGYPIEQLAEKSTFLEARDMISDSDEIVLCIWTYTCDEIIC